MDNLNDLFHKCLLEYIGFGGVYKFDEVTEGLFDVIPAGVVITVANAILSISGPLDINQMMYGIDISRQYSEYSSEDRILSLVSSVSNIKEDDLNKMEWSRIRDIIAQSELVLTKQLPEVPFRISEPTTHTGIDFEKENRDLE